MTSVQPDPSTVGGRRRKVRRLTRELIAEAVLEVGFDGLTVTAVAERLDVAHASLYRHVQGRDDLVAAGVERLLATAEWPELTGGWRVDLEAQAWLLWRLLEAHPGVAYETAVLERAPSAIQRCIELTAAHLCSLGFDDEGAALAADSVYDLVFDVFARTRLILADRPSDPSGPYWFGRKLEVVLVGIEHLVAPVK